MAREKKQEQQPKPESENFEFKASENFDELIDNTVISDDVIAVIAYMAVKEVPGVVAMGGSLMGDIVEKFGKRSHDRGIKVMTKGENVVIDISIFIEYGVKIPEMSVQIQNNVRKSVEEMAGKKVVAINLIIQGIKIHAPEEEDTFEVR